ncbi:ef5b867d-b5a6-434f-92f7-e503930e1382-CDS [Sclerotinia trifoliorum]|uniref:Ef5b867d-b5a6-434f-92f7-e503930e1382-CDS n=1 Tax=Sclerotinia trifoliorum TaxID=28548 RepID=A0A8H2W288_9HELO|nr:ef5b867d-b5a6-434f-92f7-e503930e1382-CDS [Sclerotinia trifoliorum]
MSLVFEPSDSLLYLLQASKQTTFVLFHSVLQAQASQSQKHPQLRNNIYRLSKLSIHIITCKMQPSIFLVAFAAAAAATASDASAATSAVAPVTTGTFSNGTATNGSFVSPTATGASSTSKAAAPANFVPAGALAAAAAGMVYLL